MRGFVAGLLLGLVAGPVLRLLWAWTPWAVAVAVLVASLVAVVVWFVRLLEGAFRL